jgi:chromosome segregation ATPase
MKPIPIVLSVLVVVLATALFLRDRNARSQLDAARAQTANRDRQLAETTAQWNQLRRTGYDLLVESSKCKETLGATSNRLAKVTSQLQQAEAAANAAREERKTEADRTAGLAAKVRDEWLHKNGELQTRLGAREDEIAALRTKLAAEVEARSGLTKTVDRLQAEKAEWTRQFNDPTALRAQLASLKASQALESKPAPQKPAVHARPEKGAEVLVSTKNKGYPPPANSWSKLQLQPDGSVKLLPAATQQ